jgi:spore germination protein KB
MPKEIITEKQAIATTILFISGSSLVLGTAVGAKQDVWLAIIIAILFSFPAILVYARILSLFRGKDLFDILQALFGKILGRVISVIYILYSFHLGALVLRNFGEFIGVVGLESTPMIVPMISLILLCIWAVREGPELLGRWGEFFLIILVLLLVSTIFLAIPEMRLDILKPVLYDGLTPVLTGGFSTFAFPFAETVVLTMTISSLQKGKSYYKVYMLGLLIGGTILFLASSRNLLVLGPDIIAIVNFPSYTAVSRINIGDFLQRIEIIVSIGLLIGGFVKISVCLLAASKGVAKIFGFSDYKFLITPIGLLMFNLAYILYRNIMEMRRWAFEVYQYYAFPFQVILPLLILVVGEYHIRRRKRKKCNEERRTINKE